MEVQLYHTNLRNTQLFKKQAHDIIRGGLLGPDPFLFGVHGDNGDLSKLQT
jgi:hypothetical protein